ncbi:MAG: peptidylprolyl isomerase [bacterium]|nr:peptidylprolyl isomerase [bacterium]
MKVAIKIAGHLAVLLMMSAPVFAERVLIERIVAVVDDDAIFLSDVDQAAKQFLIQRGMTDVGDAQRVEIEKVALKELINSRLILAKANRLGIRASFSEIEKMVDRAIDDNMKALGGKETFERQLAAEGFTIDTLKQLYRDQIRNKMLVDRVLASEIDRRSLRISEEELLAKYEERISAMPLRPPVIHLASIYFAFDSSENAKASASGKIEDLYRRVRNGEDFQELTKEYSEDGTAKNGGYLGWLPLEDLSDKRFADAASKLAIGEVSEPVFTSYGYHLIQLVGRNEENREVELRHLLIHVEAGDDDIQEVFKRASEVHAEVVAGADFSEMAKEHSDDPGTASSGGDLGWLKQDDLPEFFRDVLETMVVGDVSQVLREPSGFRIVKLLEQEDARPFTFDEVKDELRKSVQEKKIADMYDSYIAGLRDEFYVEIRVN